MPTELRVLIVEDSADDTELVLRMLSRHGYAPRAERVDTPAALAEALARQPWDVIIADYSMPHMNGMEALRIVRERDADTPFIIVSGSIGEDIAVAAMKAGAQDYIMKHNTARLVPAIERELAEAEVHRGRRRAEERNRYLAYYDPLTGLPNRVQFLERLEGAVAACRDRQRFALLVLDLNHFREIDDTLGYASGDTLLREAAQRLRNALTERDLLARLGAHDFAVLLSDAGAEQATWLAERILLDLAAPFEIGGLTLSVGARIGIAACPEHGASARELLQHADVAMALQHQGTSSYGVYQALLDPCNPERLVLMGELHQAIHTKQLIPHFQPKFDLRTGALSGAEALMRWQHPRRGQVLPEEFIPLAERTGMITALTYHLLEWTMDRVHGWRTPVAVNLSAKDLLDRELVERIETMLADREMEARMLELEITETSLMEDPARALDVLAVLRDMGIALYIDDFGTGYSSLGYLKKLPIEAVKIDKTFVADMAGNADSETIVRSTIDLAHNLGMKVVAEGVENEEVLERLSAFGCDEVQGYLLSHPLPADDFERRLTSGAIRPRRA
jgi:diguanylate cyclase (GGDEF)-like protein